MQLPALVVFDLGGTTIRDRGEVPAAFTSAIEAAGLAVDPTAIDSWRGASKREVLQRLVAAAHPSLAEADRTALVARSYAHFCTVLAERLMRTPDLALPESRKAFERLQHAGVRVAINSGFDRSTLDVILRVVAWPSGLVDALVCSDDVASGRPAPWMILRAMELTGVADARRVAVVGDTVLDLEAGANAGAAWRIGVLTGAHDRARLARAPHTHILESVGQVPGVWLSEAQ